MGLRVMCLRSVQICFLSANKKTAPKEAAKQILDSCIRNNKDHILHNTEIFKAQTFCFKKLNGFGFANCFDKFAHAARCVLCVHGLCSFGCGDDVGGNDAAYDCGDDEGGLDDMSRDEKKGLHYLPPFVSIVFGCTNSASYISMIQSLECKISSSNAGSLLRYTAVLPDSYVIITHFIVFVLWFEVAPVWGRVVVIGCCCFLFAQATDRSLCKCRLVVADILHQIHVIDR